MGTKVTESSCISVLLIKFGFFTVNEGLSVG